MKCPVEVTANHTCYDRSRTTADWNCPRDRWWSYEYDGTGVAPEQTPQELATGIVQHDALCAIAIEQKSTGSVDIDVIAHAAWDRMIAIHAPAGDDPKFDERMAYAKEQASLLEGLTRGFYKHVWTRLMRDYDIVLVEEELFYIHDEYGKPDVEKGRYIFMSKPDLVLRRKSDGELVYIEYKTTGTKSEEWINSWDKAVQVHSTIWAIEQSLGEKPQGVIVQGLYKGYVSYGKLSSPFAYAYHRQGSPPFTKAETTYDYKAGYRKVPVCDLDGGVKAWIENMPENVLAEQFPQTPLIFPDDDIAEDYFAQRAMRELEIKMAKQMLDAGVDKRVVLNGTFPQRFDRCKPAYGQKVKPCSKLFLCHGSGAKAPLSCGFVKRHPHHELEIATQEKATQDEVSQTSETETKA